MPRTLAFVSTLLLAAFCALPAQADSFIMRLLNKPVPGGVAVVDLGEEGPPPRAFYQGKPVLVVREEGRRWIAVVGIPLSTKPGPQKLEVRAATGNHEERFSVGSKHYREQRITLITHPLPVLAVGLALGSRVIPPRLLLAGMLAACLPDFDVVAFKLGIAYHDAFGHRGFSHSLLFAAILGALAALACRPLHSGPLKAGLWVALATASHSLLDAMTNGGLGVAWFWPWSDARYFMPFHPIAVSPIGLSRFLSERGLLVLQSEARWVWLPCLLLALAGMALRFLLRRSR